MIRSLLRILLAIVVAAAIIAGGGWLLVHELTDPYPLYSGQPIAYWLKQLNSPNSETSNQVHQVLESDILPRLTTTLSSDRTDSKIKPFLVRQLNQLPGVNIDFMPAGSRRAGAATLLGQIGPPASQTIPLLLESSKHDPDKDVRAMSGHALTQVCRDPAVAVPILTKSLENPDPQNGLTETVINLLGGFGPASKAAVPKLIALAKSPNLKVQESARRALAKIAPESGDVEQTASSAAGTPRSAKP